MLNIGGDILVDCLHYVSGFLLWNPEIYIFLQMHNCIPQSMHGSHIQVFKYIQGNK